MFSKDHLVSKDVGIKVIADALRISASTVSRALNGVQGVNPITRQLVVDTAKDMGYIPNLGAKQLVSKRSNLIGVFIPDADNNSGFFGMFSSLQRTIQSFGKDALFFSIPFKEYPAHRLTVCVNSRKLEGCLLFPAFSISHPIIQEALQLEIPCVNFENIVGSRCSSVMSDDWEGGRLAGRWLMEAGHRVIGYIDGPRHIRVCQERYRGFIDVLGEQGILHETSLVGTGDFSGTSGAVAAMELWNRNPEMSAIFCANDLMAAGAIMALTNNDIKVPEQISLVGYDDDQYAAFTTPPLTTIRHAMEQVYVQSVNLLIELLEGGKGRSVSVPPVLVERQSVRSVR